MRTDTKVTTHTYLIHYTVNCEKCDESYQCVHKQVAAIDYSTVRSGTFKSSTSSSTDDYRDSAAEMVKCLKEGKGKLGLTGFSPCPKCGYVQSAHQWGYFSGLSQYEGHVNTILKNCGLWLLFVFLTLPLLFSVSKFLMGVIIFGLAGIVLFVIPQIRSRLMRKEYGNPKVKDADSLIHVI